MVFYFLITAVTIALAGLMDAVWTRTGQEAGGVVRCAGQAAESAASGNGRCACGIPSSGGGSFPAGVSRRRAFDIVCLAAIFLILAGVSALRLRSVTITANMSKISTKSGREPIRRMW